MKTLSIFDNYLRDPERLILESKKLQYQRSTLNPSNVISTKSKYASDFYRRLIKFHGKKIDWEDSSGNYRKTTQQEVIQYKNTFFAHSDGITDFVAILYLSKPEECHGGTGFYRHIATGLEGFHDEPKVLEVMKKHKISFDDLVIELDRDARNPKAWELTDRIDMQYNRILIYNGRIFHSHIFEFHKVKSGTNRLTFVCFGTTKNK